MNENEILWINLKYPKKYDLIQIITGIFIFIIIAISLIFGILLLSNDISIFCFSFFGAFFAAFVSGLIKFISHQKRKSKLPIKVGFSNRSFHLVYLPPLPDKSISYDQLEIKSYSKNFFWTFKGYGIIIIPGDLLIFTEKDILKNIYRLIKKYKNNYYPQQTNQFNPFNNLPNNSNSIQIYTPSQNRYCPYCNSILSYSNSQFYCGICNRYL